MQYGEARDLGRATNTALLQAVSQMDEELGILFGAATAVIARILPVLVETALFVDRCNDPNFGTRNTQVAMLQGEIAAFPDQSTQEEDSAFLNPTLPNRPVARTLAWTASWTPWWKMPATLLRPCCTVFNFNPLLAADAKASPERFRYENCELTLRDAIDSMPAHAPTNQLKEKAGELFANVVCNIPVSSDIRDRLIAVLTERSAVLLANIYRVMRGLADQPDLPENLWAGTGGYWPSRLVGLEAKRRGGIVKRFDHGGNRILRKDLQNTAVVEATVATHVVMFTKETAAWWARQDLSNLLPGGKSVSIESPISRPVKIDRPKPTAVARDRPRVLYVSGAIRGFRQVIPAAMPDVVYLDFQFRVAEFLSRLPIDLFLRPHPDGLMGGPRHPINAVKPVAEQNFEELLKECDVVVLDSPFSRVIGSALGSSKQVVFLDPGYDYFREDISPVVRERCHVISLTQDDRGRFHFDADQLSASVCSLQSPDADVVYQLKKLFGGYL